MDNPDVALIGYPRSPLLVDTRAAPSRRWRRRHTVGVGIAIAAAAVILALALVYSAHAVPSRNPLGWALYKFHDEVLLVLKGNLWNRFFPYSPIFWIVATAVLLLEWLAPRWRRTIIRSAHLAAIRTVVRLPLLHGPVIQITRLLSRVGITSQALREQATLSSLTLSRRLQTRPLGAPSAARSVQAAQLAIALHLDRPRPVTDYILPAHVLHEALLGLALRGQLATARAMLEDGLGAFAPLLRTGLQPTPLAAGPWAIQSFARDLVNLFCLQVERLPQNSLAGPQAPTASAGDLERLRIELAVSVDNRRNTLEQARYALERFQLRRYFGHTPAPLSDLQNQLAGLTPTTLRLLGELTMGLAVHVAARGQAPEIARNTLEAIEALTFVLELAIGRESSTAGDSSAEIAKVVQSLSGLLRGLPRPEHFDVTASIWQSGEQCRFETWLALATPDGLIRREDVQRVSDRIDSLRVAAGAPFSGDDAERTGE